MTGRRSERGFALFEWINLHVWPVTATLVVVAVALALLTPVVADKGEPSFSPGGEIYDTEDRAGEVFTTSSPIREVLLIVESPDGGDVLTRDALLELSRNQAALRADPESRQHLANSFDRTLGLTVDGIFSIADAVDQAVPGGLEAATDADVKAALSALLADEAPTRNLRFLLSTSNTQRTPETIDGSEIVVWESPAFFARLLYDADTFSTDAVVESFGEVTNLDAERWLREVQAIVRGDQQSVTAIGVTIDGGLVAEEQSATAGPFIFLAVAFILIIVGALLRSYWAAMLVGVGLGIVMMGYNGFNAFLQLKTNSPLLILIVPIALISFGVDFFIHGSGRVREMQVDGHSRDRAYPLGMTAVFAALLLAALSSAAAFLSNAVSGIQAIIEFGIAAAIALLLSYLVLGWVVPRLLLAIEGLLGPRPAEPSHLRVVGQKLGFVAASLIGGVAVTLTIVFPAIGWAAYLVFLVLFVVVPFFLTRRRNRRAAAGGAPLTEEVKGAGHGFKAAGSVVHFLARWRVFTVPAVLALAVIGLIGAFQVEKGFEVKDFFSSKTDFVISLDKLDQYFEAPTASDYLYIEGDLTSPDTLIALRLAEDELAASDADFVRDFDGELEVGPNAVTVVELATASEAVRSAVEAESGVEITDADADGLADTPEQVGAIYRYAKANGLVNDDGIEVFRPDQVETFLSVEGDTQATRVDVFVTSFTDDPIVLAARDALETAAASLEQRVAGQEIATVSVSGVAIVSQDVLDSFTSSMLQSLPVAVLLTSLLVLIALIVLFRSYGRRPASIAKRSLRYAIVSMVPILLVVAWIYGFMYLVGYKINMITATIAAIAIGVGIDYATHFTMRFIQEFEGEPSRFPALRRAGEGTGGALAISALTSMTGFIVMAFAPMPMFQTFGVLTAVMILFALLVSLLVLPSLLLLITPSRKGEEREQLIIDVTAGEYEYEPHARDTAIRHSGAGH